MDGNITLIVKSPNQSVDDYHIECNMDWTVLRLKETLASSFPSNPNIEEQRLIYSGKLMPDKVNLRSVLRHTTENNSYTIHLVCLPSLRKQPTTDTANMPTPSENTNSTDGVRRRTNTNITNTSSVGESTNTDTTNIYPIPQLTNIAPMALADPVQQVAAYQQMYAQYMASYMNYMQNASANPFQLQMSFQPPNTSSTTTTTQSTPPVQPNNQENQPQEPVNQQPPPPVRNIQADGLADDDDNERRDWLEYLYIGCRLTFFLTFVYLYSSVSKFMLVFLTASFVYFYQTGWFRFQDRAENPGPQAAPEPGPVPRAEQQQNNQEEPNNNIQNNNNNEVPVVDDDDSTTTNNEVISPAPRASLLSLSWTFIVTFFSSLLPEQNPQLV